MAKSARGDGTTARNRFLAACSLAGASTTTFRGPRRDGDETPSWIDIARLGSPDAPAVLVLCCGLHGIEGLCGSAIFSAWLSQGLQRDLPRDTGLIFVHTVLPEGLAIGGTPAPDNVANRDWSDNILSAAARRFARYARSKGFGEDGDDQAPPLPAGPSARLTEAFDATAAEILEHAERVCVVEFHTSMTAAGTVTVSSCHAGGTAADARVAAWFGEAAGAGADGPAALDSFALGFGGRLRDIDLTAIHVDFGTYSTKAVLRLDARRDPAARHADMGRLFFPDDAGWTGHVRAEGCRVIQRIMRRFSGEPPARAAQRP